MATATTTTANPLENPTSPGFCIVSYYSPAWAVGTGLRVSLKPGRYRITGVNEVRGERFFYLNGTYHCPAHICRRVS